MERPAPNHLSDRDLWSVQPWSHKYQAVPGLQHFDIIASPMQDRTVSHREKKEVISPNLLSNIVQIELHIGHQDAKKLRAPKNRVPCTHREDM